ncbi:unnamed protein product [Cercospora beticola]|nr:unnamed protein product [Cercospora beticola]
MDGHQCPQTSSIPSRAYQQKRRLRQIRTMSIESTISYSNFEDTSKPMLLRQARRQTRRQRLQGAEYVRHQRTRSGCYTCRQRRVKCDESYPICERCWKGKRECTYPTNAASAPETASTTHWNSLTDEAKYYLKFHQQHITHHYYAFNHDREGFLKTAFMEIAINDQSAALLHAILAFAAYHHTIGQNDSDISTFLSYYN